MLKFRIGSCIGVTLEAKLAIAFYIERREAHLV